MEENTGGIEEFRNYLAQQRQLAETNTLPRQREIVWGSYFVKPLDHPVMGLFVFGQAMTLAELLLRDAEAGANEVELDYYRRKLLESYASGLRWGDHFSVIEPDGEFGSSHIVSCWPITEQEFEEAHSLGWLPSKEMRDRIVESVIEARRSHD